MVAASVVREARLTCHPMTEVHPGDVVSTSTYDRSCEKRDFV